jgi:hypothetical protein
MSCIAVGNGRPSVNFVLTGTHTMVRWEEPVPFWGISSGGWQIA